MNSGSFFDDPRVDGRWGEIPDGFVEIPSGYRSWLAALAKGDPDLFTKVGVVGFDFKPILLFENARSVTPTSTIPSPIWGPPWVLAVLAGTPSVGLDRTPHWEPRSALDRSWALRRAAAASAEAQRILAATFALGGGAEVANVIDTLLPYAKDYLEYAGR